MPSRLHVKPRKAEINVKGGLSRHRIRCIGDKRLAFKVSANTKHHEYYMVNPVVGFINPGESREIRIIRLPGGKTCKDTFRILYIVAPSGFDPRQPFMEGAQKGTVRIKMKVVDKEPEELSDTSFKGELVSEIGQIWQKKTITDEDKRIEKEVEKLPDDSEGDERNAEEKEREKRKKEGKKAVKSEGHSDKKENQSDGDEKKQHGEKKKEKKKKKKIESNSVGEAARNRLKYSRWEESKILVCCTSELISE